MPETVPHSGADTLRSGRSRANLRRNEEWEHHRYAVRDLDVLEDH
jgi:hypothetical protein